MPVSLHVAAPESPIAPTAFHMAGAKTSTASILFRVCGAESSTMPVSLHVAAPESSTTPNSLHVRDPESSTVPDSFHVRDPESSTVPDSFHRNHSRGAKSAPWRISQCPGKHNGFVSWEYAQHHLPHHLKKPPQPPIRSTPRFGMEGKRHCGGFHGTKRGPWRTPPQA